MTDLETQWMRILDSAGVALEAAAGAQTLPPVEIGAHRRRLALERAWLGSVEWAARRGSKCDPPKRGASATETCGKPEAEISGHHDLWTPSVGEGERKEMVTQKDPGDRGDKIASLCRLNEALGVAEECPEETCPFWEPGGAVLSGRCAFEGLDLGGRRDLAGFLLRIREGLHSAETGAKREAHRLFFRRLNEGRGD